MYGNFPYDHIKMDLFIPKNVLRPLHFVLRININILLMYLLARFSKSSLSVLVFLNGLIKIIFLKFWPHFF